jgi:hypothetical protein
MLPGQNISTIREQTRSLSQKIPMKNPIRILLAGMLLGLWPAENSFARPEYAVR